MWNFPQFGQHVFCVIQENNLARPFDFRVLYDDKLIFAFGISQVLDKYDKMVSARMRPDDVTDEPAPAPTDAESPDLF